MGRGQQPSSAAAKPRHAPFPARHQNSANVASMRGELCGATPIRRRVVREQQPFGVVRKGDDGGRSCSVAVAVSEQGIAAGQPRDVKSRSHAIPVRCCYNCKRKLRRWLVRCAGGAGRCLMSGCPLGGTHVGRAHASALHACPQARPRLRRNACMHTSRRKGTTSAALLARLVALAIRTVAVLERRREDCRQRRRWHRRCGLGRCAAIAGDAELAHARGDGAGIRSSRFAVPDGRSAAAAGGV